MMGLTSLRKILNQKMLEKEEKGIVNPLLKGAIFPYRILNRENSFEENYFVFFLSLSCTICIDLLPEMGDVAELTKNPFLLVTDGEIEENNEIINYYNFTFDIISFADDFRKFNIPSTPFVYYVSKDNVVIDHLDFNSFPDVKNFIFNQYEEE